MSLSNTIKVIVKVRIKVRVRAVIDGWNVCYHQEPQSTGFHSQSGMYHRDAEGYFYVIMR